MRVGDLGTGLGLLQRSAKKLREAWEEAKESWHDKARHDFEAERLQPLMTQLTMTAAAVHRLADVLRNAEQSVADHQREE